MFKKGFHRVMFGALIGAFAGISFTTGVLPFVESRLLGIPSLDVLLRVKSLLGIMTLFWAVGGGSSIRTGSALGGALVLGVVGLASGYILGGYALGEGGTATLVGVLTGGLYGALGGLLLGRLFPGPRS